MYCQFLLFRCSLIYVFKVCQSLVLWLTVLAMVSLRNGSTELFRRKPKLANTQEFPRGNSAAMNYSRCWQLLFFHTFCFSAVLYSFSSLFSIPRYALRYCLSVQIAPKQFTSLSIIIKFRV